MRPRLFSMNYGLPTTVTIAGEEVPIRSDFRAMLDIMEAFNDPDLDDYDKTEVMLSIFYPEPERIADAQEAINQCLLFLDGGKEQPKKKSPRLVDWERDFGHIIAPVNRVLGYEARAVEYLHWWTFLAAYMEIGGDCVFSQIVSIRDKKARGTKLEKHEREWYRRNRNLVDLPSRYTEAEKALEKEWT